MDAERFDAMTKVLGSGADRRRVLGGLALGALAGLLGRGAAAAPKDKPPKDKKPKDKKCKPECAGGGGRCCPFDGSCATGTACCPDEFKCGGGACVPLDQCCPEDRLCANGDCIPAGSEACCDEEFKCNDGSCSDANGCCPDSRRCPNGCAPEDTCCDGERRCGDFSCVAQDQCCADERRCNDLSCVSQGGCCPEDRRCPDGSCAQECCEDRDCQGGGSDRLCCPVSTQCRENDGNGCLLNPDDCLQTRPRDGDKFCPDTGICGACCEDGDCHGGNICDRRTASCNCPENWGPCSSELCCPPGSCCALDGSLSCGPCPT